MKDIVEPIAKLIVAHTGYEISAEAITYIVMALFEDDVEACRPAQPQAAASTLCAVCVSPSRSFIRCQPR